MWPLKGRMINACHMLLAYPALLVGQRLVHEGMRDPRLVALLSTFLARDVVPFLNPTAGCRFSPPIRR